MVHWEATADTGSQRPPSDCCHCEPEPKPQNTKSVRLMAIIHLSRDSNGLSKNTLLDAPRVRKTIQYNEKDKLYIGSSGKRSQTLRATNRRVSKNTRRGSRNCNPAGPHSSSQLVKNGPTAAEG